MPLPRRQPLTPRPVRRPPRAAYRIPGAPPPDAGEEFADDVDTTPAATPVADASPNASVPTTDVDTATDVAVPSADIGADVNSSDEPEAAAADAGDTADTAAAVTEVQAPASISPSNNTAPMRAGERDLFQETAALQAPDFTTVVTPDTPTTATPEETAHVVQSIEAAAQRQRAQRAHGPATGVAVAAGAAAGSTATAVPGVGGRRVGQRVPAAGGRGAPPRNGQPKPVDMRPRWRRPRTWFLSFGLVVGVVALAVLIYAGYMGWTAWGAYNKAHVDTPDRPRFTVNSEGTPVVVPTEQAEAQLPNWDNDDPVNILLLGIDFRDGDEEPARSDTVIVARIEPATGHVRMLSIPRDLLVDIPGHGEDKMNAAYPVGEARGEDLDEEYGGPSLVAQTIEANFDIPIHYFMTVDFQGFRKIVDTVGGVVIDVRAPVKDDQYPTETFGLTREYWPTGLQFMDGETSLRYARTRHGDNDVNRGQRQQQVLRAIREQAMTLGLITRADDLMRDLADTVRTDLNFNQMLALANIGRSLDTNNIESVDLWEMGIITEHLPEWEGDAFYFEADWSMVWAVTAELFPRPGETPTGSIDIPSPQAGSSTSGSSASGSAVADADDTPISEDVAVPGINFDVPIAVRDYSTSGAGADIAANLLIESGFSLVVPEMSDDVAASTTIYNYSGSYDTALRIAETLGLGADSIVDASDGVGIVVLVGDDVAGQFGP